MTAARAGYEVHASVKLVRSTTDAGYCMVSTGGCPDSYARRSPAPCQGSLHSQDRRDLTRLPTESLTITGDTRHMRTESPSAET